MEINHNASYYASDHSVSVESWINMYDHEEKTYETGIDWENKLNNVYMLSLGEWHIVHAHLVLQWVSCQLQWRCYWTTAITAARTVTQDLCVTTANIAQPFATTANTVNGAVRSHWISCCELQPITICHDDSYCGGGHIMLRLREDTQRFQLDKCHGDGNKDDINTIMEPNPDKWPWLCNLREWDSNRNIYMCPASFSTIAHGHLSVDMLVYVLSTWTLDITFIRWVSQLKTVYLVIV
jgi:hypothetical protein